MAAKVAPKVSVQAVTTPVPTVIVPAWSLPTFAGPVPQADVVALEAAKVMCPAFVVTVDVPDNAPPTVDQKGKLFVEIADDVDTAPEPPPLAGNVVVVTNPVESITSVEVPTDGLIALIKRLSTIMPVGAP